MPATTLDSMIFRDIFTTPEMRQVFSDENRTACYLEIEAALARVQGRLGIIPPEAAREIDAKCRIENIDFAKLKGTTERIGYPILGVVQQIVAFCDKGDRKSTRLNSSHLGISYAVFCLKKKKA